MDTPGSDDVLAPAEVTTAVLLCIAVVLVAVSLAFALSSAYVAAPPRMDLVVVGDPARTRVTIRSQNTYMLPWSGKVRRQAKQAVQQGLLRGADVVMLQEVWAPLRWDSDPTCPVTALVQEAGGTAGAVASFPHKIPMGRVTNSGMCAVAASPGLSVTFLAFEPFTHLTLPDNLAHKGVAVFRITGTRRPLVVATTHMQSALTAVSRLYDPMRLGQFKQIVRAALKHGAVFLAGDINTGDPRALAAMDSFAAQATGGKAVRLVNSEKTHAEGNLDHAWILDTSVVRPVKHVVNWAVSKGWSDHAALDTTLEIIG
jgi:endonuclease/exonuclease/phosphatase family metal-dependent hydrolase